MFGQYRPTALLMFILGGLLLCAAPARPAAPDPRERAQTILDSAGVKGGLVVHLGCGNGRLTAALHAGENYVVRGLDADAKDVKKARRYIRSRGLYGDVSVGRYHGGRLPFASDLMNLVVADGSCGVAEKEIMRVLAPGGTAYLEDDGGWTKKTKSWPQEIDEWTHFLHDASNNAVAEDSRIGPPRQLRWKATPMWCRSHEFASSVNALVSANGRLFGIIDEGLLGQPRGVPARWTLVARDAFNGTLLWKRPAARSGRRSLVAAGNRLYVTLKRGGPVSILDAADGSKLVTCEKTDNAMELIHTGGQLICRVRKPKKQRRSGGKAEAVVAVDDKTGELLWRRAAKRISSGSLAAESGRVCYHAAGKLVTLELETGKKLWSTSAGGRGGYVVMHDDLVLFTGHYTTAYSAENGKKLWKTGIRARSMPGVFVANGLIWAAWTRGGEPSQADWRDVASQGRFASARGLKLWYPKKAMRKGYDPRTGKVKREVSVERLITPGHHVRCYPPKATERYLLLNKRGVEFLDLSGENSMRHNWLRAPCSYGVMPANGLLYMPPHQCFCYPGVLLAGFNAMTSRAGPDIASSDTAGKVVRGPGWKEVNTSEEKDDEQKWPTYRHDPRRSSSVNWTPPAAPEKLWSAELGGKLSPPVAADGRLFVAGVESHAVRCLNAENGEPLWTYTTGARVDSPPTIYRGLVLFGSTDGWIYCLRAEDGALVWRFRAAPARQWITVRGQLESAWPSHGSVLVRGGKVYVTAGRSSYLEGGIRLYALEPETGEVLHSHVLNSGRPDVSRNAGRPFDMEGARSDLLVAADEDIYMMQKRFNPDLTLEPTPRGTKLGDRRCERHLMTTAGFLARQWSNGAFNRVYWTHSNRWPGYYFSYEAPKSGQILAFNEETTYSVKYYSRRHGHSPEYKPGTGYRLIADRTENDPVLRPARFGQEKGGGYSRAAFWKWASEVPVRVEAMVLGGKHLYLAGPPDVGPGKKAAAAMRGQRGARFRVVSADGGEKLSSLRMEKAPVFDGLIAAYGRLYMATQDGTIVCLGDKAAE